MQYTRERIAFLEQQLEIEVQIRKQAEALNEQLHQQMMDCQREMEDVVNKCNSATSIPDNCSLVSKDELQSLLQEYNFITFSTKFKYKMLMWTFKGPGASCKFIDFVAQLTYANRDVDCAHIQGVN